MSFDRKTIKPTDTVELLGITLDKIINSKWHIAKKITKPKLFFCIRKVLRFE